MVWTHATSATLVATTFAVIMGVYFGQFVAPRLVNWWIALKVAVALIRVGQAQVYRRKRSPGGIVWRRFTYFTLALDGAVGDCRVLFNGSATGDSLLGHC